MRGCVSAYQPSANVYDAYRPRGDFAPVTSTREISAVMKSRAAVEFDVRWRDANEGSKGAQGL